MSGALLAAPHAETGRRAGGRQAAALSRFNFCAVAILTDPETQQPAPEVGWTLLHHGRAAAAQVTCCCRRPPGQPARSHCIYTTASCKHRCWCRPPLLSACCSRPCTLLHVHDAEVGRCAPRLAWLDGDRPASTAGAAAATSAKQQRHRHARAQAMYVHSRAHCTLHNKEPTRSAANHACHARNATPYTQQRMQHSCTRAHLFVSAFSTHTKLS